MPAALVACSQPSAFVPVELHIEPERAVLQVGSSVQLLANATTTDGAQSTVDVAVWRSADEAIATVSNGLVTAKQVGRVTIFATWAGMTSTARVSVEAVDAGARDAGLTVDAGHDAGQLDAGAPPDAGTFDGGVTDAGVDAGLLDACASCGPHSTCVNGACVCATGFQDNDHDGLCVATCATAPLSCPSHAACDDTGGLPRCACATGFQDVDRDGTCTPTCATAGVSCGATRVCDDTSGTAQCRCATGLQDNDFNGVCTSTCTTAGLSCAANAVCSDASGTARCTCAADFQDNDGNGTCTPSCNRGPLCGANASCTDASGTARCACNAGFQDNDNDGFCAPSCTSTACGSAIQATCSDSSGAIRCTCQPGFSGARCETCILRVRSGSTGTTGLSWAEAYGSIQAAIDRANTILTASGSSASVCEVWVARGTGYSTYVSSATDAITLRSNVWLFGGFEGTETLRTQRDPARPTFVTGLSATSTNRSYHAFLANNVSNGVIDGFEITGALANAPNPNDRGPAVGLFGSAVTLSNLRIHDTTAGAEGGGISVVGGAVQILDSTITRTTAGQRGGGIYVTAATSLLVDRVSVSNSSSVLGGGGLLVFASGTTPITITRSTFVNNTTQSSGGGVLVSLGQLTFTDNVLVANTAGSAGGGLSLAQATATKVARSLFLGNFAGRGGGIADTTDNTAVVAHTFENVIVAGNVADRGGALWRGGNTDRTTSFVNVTLVGNRAFTRGNALETETGSAMQLTNSIVWAHQAYSTSVVDFAGTAPAFSRCVIDTAGLATGNNLSADPRLAALPNWWDTFSSGTTTTVSVREPARYQVGDDLVFSNDWSVGTRRRITAIDINSSTVTFTPALDTALVSGTFSLWRASGTAIFSALPTTGSSAIDAANGDAAPATDFANVSRVDDPAVVNTGTGVTPFADIGAREKP